LAKPANIQRGESPFRLNLEQQRKCAKELLKGLCAGEADALRRFHLFHPQAAALGPTQLMHLSEAQLVIARELGLPSWPKLKAHIEAMDRARERIARGEPAPDRDLPTLHIRCGSDIAPTLKAAGFVGDFLEYSDPLCHGPVVDEAGWLDRRAAFLADAYGVWTGQTKQQITDKLAVAEERLHSAAACYHRIALWFEHDIYDQLILARCLAQFTVTAPAQLELISPARYPGGVRFIGLGQLPPEALRLLWNERERVSPDSMRAGHTVWKRLRRPDPRPLSEVAVAGIPGLPQLARAIRRHCQELPWTSDGLSLTERLILELLSERPRTVGETFYYLMMEREPLPWLGDLMFRFVVESMKSVNQPVFTAAFDGDDRSWPKQRLTITELGRAILAREVNWLSLHPPVRWIGGVSIPGTPPRWRWDEGASGIVGG
jgi:Domain of unknown function (DUF1835)